MLRITTENSLGSMNIKLEGKLVGAWVYELEHAWQEMARRNFIKSLVVDLCDVTFIDAKGKLLLKKMRRQGATFRCCGPDITATVEDVNGKA